MSPLLASLLVRLFLALASCVAFSVMSVQPERKDSSPELSQTQPLEAASQASSASSQTPSRFCLSVTSSAVDTSSISSVFSAPTGSAKVFADRLSSSPTSAAASAALQYGGKTRKFVQNNPFVVTACHVVAVAILADAASRAADLDEEKLTELLEGLRVLAANISFDLVRRIATAVLSLTALTPIEDALKSTSKQPDREAVVQTVRSLLIDGIEMDGKGIAKRFRSPQKSRLDCLDSSYTLDNKHCTPSSSTPDDEDDDGEEEVAVSSKPAPRAAPSRSSSAPSASNRSAATTHAQPAQPAAPASVIHLGQESMAELAKRVSDMGQQIGVMADAVMALQKQRQSPSSDQAPATHPAASSITQPAKAPKEGQFVVFNPKSRSIGSFLSFVTRRIRSHHLQAQVPNISATETADGSISVHIRGKKQDQQKLHRVLLRIIAGANDFQVTGTGLNPPATLTTPKQRTHFWPRGAPSHHSNRGQFRSGWNRQRNRPGYGRVPHMPQPMPGPTPVPFPVPVPAANTFYGGMPPWQPWAQAGGPRFPQWGWSPGAPQWF